MDTAQQVTRLGQSILEHQTVLKELEGKLRHI